MTLDETVEALLLQVDALVEVARAQRSAASMGRLCNDIAAQYRALALCGLLLHGDIDLFSHGLTQSALTRKYYLARCRDENHLGDPARRTSLVGPFHDAVAAGRFGLARRIADLSPDRWWEGHEYEDDFAYAYFLHRLVRFDAAEAGARAAVLDRFEQALEGQPSVRLDVCRALQDADQEGFDAAFPALLDAYGTAMSAIADPALDSVLALDFTFTPNRWICVEGLALLRIADRLGLRVEPDYTYCPSLARVPSRAPFVPDAFPYLIPDSE